MKNDQNQGYRWLGWLLRMNGWMDLGVASNLPERAGVCVLGEWQGQGDEERGGGEEGGGLKGRSDERERGWTTTTTKDPVQSRRWRRGEGVWAIGDDSGPEDEMMELCHGTV